MTHENSVDSSVLGASGRYYRALKELVSIDNSIGADPRLLGSIVNREGFIWEVNRNILDGNNNPVHPLDTDRQVLIRFSANQPDLLHMVTESATSGIELTSIKLKGGSSEEITSWYSVINMPVSEPDGCLMELVSFSIKDKKTKEMWDVFLNARFLSDQEKDAVFKAHNKLFGELKDSQEPWVRALRENPNEAINAWVKYGVVPRAELN